VRYFVVCFPDLPQIAPYIVAEVVRDVPRADRDVSFASAVAGERAQIATRAELMADPRTRSAIEAWEGRDDTQFEMETLYLTEDDRPVTYLRLVDDEAPEPRRFRPQLPNHPAHREAVLRSRALRAEARALMQRAREEREVDNRRSERITRLVVNHE
jgi:hypothetical protein